jgi:hypothetical protein
MDIKEGGNFTGVEEGGFIDNPVLLNHEPVQEWLITLPAGVNFKIKPTTVAGMFPNSNVVDGDRMLYFQTDKPMTLVKDGDHLRFKVMGL